jgi:hypothetical protein
VNIPGANVSELNGALTRVLTSLERKDTKPRS